ncbi:hypothetical protein [Arthrobacter sp. OY3WO11]|uniref:hypothetical protein n=1 Tax=Arthrobacter sp. OY3WO11 TaxID=1835723 RepID=UPI0007CFD570|nr:hypothetical protein [Arthrobacter sp. OY3WO11]OAE01853.1 hypothetical protein A6A22_10825 [Arthrobacter sp. OY3WO11]
MNDFPFPEQIVRKAVELADGQILLVEEQVGVSVQIDGAVSETKLDMSPASWKAMRAANPKDIVLDKTGRTLTLKDKSNKQDKA